MNNKLNRIIAPVFVGLFGILMSSCQEDEIRTLDTQPGNFLDITGEDLVYVGDELSYSLFLNRTDVDYSWSIEDGATITEDEANDAYVEIAFNQPGTYQLDVSAGEAAGGMAIEAVSHEVSFEKDSVSYTESLSSMDILEIPLNVTGGLNSSIGGSLAYTIGGTIASERYAVLDGYTSPFAFVDSLGVIKIAIYDDEEMNVGETLVLNITSVTPDFSGAYVKADTLQSIVYTFVDDVKEVSLDSTTVELDEAGVYAIPVSLSNASNSAISVAYSLSPAVGVNDISQEVARGVLSFPAGTVSKDITIDVSESAFIAEQSFTVVLDGVVTEDGEVVIDEDLASKTYTITEEE